MAPEPRGFIALTSALVISAVLLVLITGASLSGFYTRMNALRDEYKEKSYALALACATETLLALAGNPSYAGSATTTVTSGGVCYTGPVTKTGFFPSQTYTFRTRSYLGNSYTSFSVVANASDLSVESMSEVPSF